MEFDKSRVYTALNADELKVGSDVIVANNMASLKGKVFNECKTWKVKDILEGSYERRFQTDSGPYPLAYLVAEPEEKRLKWTDLVIGDIITDGFNVAMVTHISSIDDEEEHVYAGAWWINDKELERDWEKVDR